MNEQQYLKIINKLMVTIGYAIGATDHEPGHNIQDLHDYLVERIELIQKELDDVQ